MKYSSEMQIWDMTFGTSSQTEDNDTDDEITIMRDR